MSRKYTLSLDFSFHSTTDDDGNAVLHKIFTVKFLFSFTFLFKLFKANSVVGNGWFQLTQFVLCSFHV